MDSHITEESVNLLINFVQRIREKGIDEIIDDDIFEMSEYAVGGVIAEIYVLALGLEGAMRAAYCIGAAWQKELIEANNKKTEGLLKDINLGE
jgi:hypothetical protein